MSNYYTQTAERPDLTPDVLKIKMPENFIGSKLMPTLFSSQQTGKVYYSTVVSGTAQTDRNAGEAPTGQQIANSSTTFSCGEKIDRGSVAEEEVKHMAGVAEADLAGSRKAVRAVIAAVEADIADAVLNTSDDADKEFAIATFLEDAQNAVEATEPYGGKTYLAGAKSVVLKLIKAILADSTIGPMFRSIATGANPAVASTGLSFGAWCNALAMLLDVDEVIVGANSVWAAAETGRESRFVIGKFSDGEDDLDYKYLPTFGRNVVYLPDDGNRDFPFRLFSVADYGAHNNHYDCQSFVSPLVLNRGAATVFEFPAESEGSGET